MTVLRRSVVCPDCRGDLDVPDQGPLTCTSCGRSFPRAGNGVPVLLPLDSAFDPEKIAAGRDTYYENRASEDVRKQRFRRSLPGLALDLQTGDADELVNRLIRAGDADTPVAGLVIGAGFRVEEYRRRFPEVDWLVTDTEATFGADVVGDALRLPVADGTISFVLCEHVLEHVLDPLAAGREIERVLRPGGLALVKVPFNYPWHGGYVDFFRFTPAGYLATFRRMEVVHLGHGPGPASTITYALQQAWTSLFQGRTTRRVAVVLGRLVIGPWRHLDRILVTRRGSLGSSCSMIFVGRRVDAVRSAGEVVDEARALGVAPVVAPSARKI